MIRQGTIFNLYSPKMSDGLLNIDRNITAIMIHMFKVHFVCLLCFPHCQTYLMTGNVAVKCAFAVFHPRNCGKINMKGKEQGDSLISVTLSE